jgi:hypothetical protein
MTEQELSVTLGIWHEPECNRLRPYQSMSGDLRQAMAAMQQARLQHQHNGWVPLALWLEFLPWHSLN